MKLLFTGQYTQIPRNIMRRCGYGEIVTRAGKRSYAKRIRGGEFPRFHAYIDIKDNGFQINLHLDQKAACYAGSSAHSGEYDGEVVEREGERIRTIVDSFKA